ncbi:uncharacterized protein LOC126704900 [Quercus robur]|uniref:uncharacterized protein LOC126704900 n=1 Tax=Quercus robur TaxID=38942 RepID=UPI0021638202|nr:uncharacterized protein LOC126704900 [Quercus robur]
MEECLDAVQQKVTPAMRDILSSDFSVEEIKTALFQMGSTKAPGPDGMNALFYQKYWHIVGDDVIAAVLDFLNSGYMIPEINYTRFVLIPKILPQLIAPTQSAFVPGRLIMDNVLVAYETLHAMHCGKSGKKGSLALKLDVICINGKAYGNIIPSRGLRQGDPLSPYLFLLCAEGFTTLLAKSENEGRLNGVEVCRSAPCISHLLFADDSLLFCQASQEEVQCIIDILQLYADSSG